MTMGPATGIALLMLCALFVKSYSLEDQPEDEDSPSARANLLTDSQTRSVVQFRSGILCLMPESRPIRDYNGYGCYCGKGGSGTPVDDLDRCCQVHDQCYSDAKQHSDCRPFIDSPYIEHYHYCCDKVKKKFTCLSENNPCEMFICECDRKAAECFAISTWNPKNRHLSPCDCSE